MRVVEKREIGMTEFGKREIVKRERVMKGLCEMAILRCLRPDMLIENMNRFVLNV